MKKLILLLSLFSSYALTADMSDLITEIPYGSKLTIRKEIIIPAHESVVTLFDGYWVGKFKYPASVTLHLKSHSKERRLRVGRVLGIDSVSSDENECDSDYMEDITGTYYTVEAYVDHPQINYVKFKNGAFIDGRCKWWEPEAGDLNNSDRTGYYFSFSFPAIEDL